MSRKYRPAFTLIELLVSIALGMLMLGLIVGLYIQFRRDTESPMASMSMEQSTISLMRWLQRDLSETNLQSIRSFSDGSGVGFASPRNAKDELMLSSYGIVQWQKYVYFRVTEYTPAIPPPPKVLMDGAQIVAATGELKYHETPVAPPASGEATTAPAAPALSPSRDRTLSRNFMINKNDSSLGCFVYYPEDGVPTFFDETHRGEPVCVALYLMDVSSSTGQPTLRRLFMQVRPKN